MEGAEREADLATGDAAPHEPVEEAATEQDVWVRGSCSDRSWSGADEQGIQVQRSQTKAAERDIWGWGSFSDRPWAIAVK